MILVLYTTVVNSLSGLTCENTLSLPFTNNVDGRNAQNKKRRERIMVIFIFIILSPFSEVMDQSSTHLKK